MTMLTALTKEQRGIWLSASRLPADRIAPLLLKHESAEWLEEPFTGRIRN